MRRPMSSRTTSACGCWPRRTAGAAPDMDPVFTRTFRASMVARARFVEDLVLEQAAQGVAQYVILGAGLDSFAQRRPDIASRMRVRSGPARAAGMEAPATGRAGLRRAGMAATGPGGLRGGASAWQALAEAGFDATRPAFVASTGVSMYLTRDATLATFRQVARCARLHARHDVHAAGGQMAPEVRPGIEMAVKGARASGHRSSASMRRPRSWRWRGRRVPRCPARRARRTRAAVLRGERMA